MQRAATPAIVLVAIVLATGSARAAWIWRDEDKTWIYVDDGVPALSPSGTEAAPAQPSPVRPGGEDAERPAPRPIRPTPAPAEGDDVPEPKPARPAITRAPEKAETGPAPRSDSPVVESRREGAAPEAPWYKRMFGGGPTAEKERRLYREGTEAWEAGQYARAEKAFRKLVDDFPTSANRSEALWLLAESLFRRKEYYKAYEQYEALIEQYAGSPHYHDALRREIEIADLYLGPARRRVLGVPVLSGEAEAVEILRRVYEHQPLGDLADDVVLKIADHYCDKRQWEEAEEYYDKYCREYQNVNPEKCRYAELQRAKCAIETCRGARYDTTSLGLARDRLRQYQEKYPDQAKAEGVPLLLQEVRSMMAESDYHVAAYYRRRGRDEAAAFYARRVQREYPDTPWAEKAGRLLGKLDVGPPEGTAPAAGAK